MRAPASAPPSPQAGEGSKIKKHLVIGILSSCFVLMVLIGVKVYRILVQKDIVQINVADEWKSAFDTAETASKDILRVEFKMWTQEKAALTKEDLDLIKAKLDEMRKTEQTLRGLMDRLHEKQKMDSQEWQDIPPKLTRVKLWILDADDLLESKAPDYGGYFIPMNRTVEASRKARKDLLEMEQAKAELGAATNAEEKDKAAKKVRQIEMTLKGLQEKFGKIEDYLKDGLAKDSLDPRQLPDIEVMREEANLVGMAIKQSLTLRALLQN